MTPHTQWEILGNTKTNGSTDNV